MNTWDKCKNCGGNYGIHHYKTNQCPVSGREAPIGRKQEWKTTIFELETNNKDEEIACLRELIRGLSLVAEHALDGGEFNGVVREQAQRYFDEARAELGMVKS